MLPPANFLSFSLCTEVTTDQMVLSCGFLTKSCGLKLGLGYLHISGRSLWF